MTGAGVDNYAFEYWTDYGPYSSWDWDDPATELTGKDNLEGAMNLLIQFECMNSPSYNASPGYQIDIAFNPLDVNYVYELLCTNNYVGSNDSKALLGIDRNNIDCSRVGLNGVSGGGLTAQLFLNDCFANLTMTSQIRAIATVVAGFYPLVIGGNATCPADLSNPSPAYQYSYTRSVPLFMKVACDDTVIPFTTFVEEQWESSLAPKYLYSRSGNHGEVTAESFILGEDLTKAFMRYYLLRDRGSTGKRALDDYPDRFNIRSTTDIETSYQYESEIGTELFGGLCRETFQQRGPSRAIDNLNFMEHYLENYEENLNDDVSILPNTN